MEVSCGVRPERRARAASFMLCNVVFVYVFLRRECDVARRPRHEDNMFKKYDEYTGEYHVERVFVLSHQSYSIL